ncbi:DUF6261 family protein [Prolixibacter denitrificans]|uniref:Uncharacterized protein n=1 Tax=Prolixibacter denitrificans TaxID=1541063 RepID=A0A2P8CFM8_9BACT|nr:DUF6261 family protein [Prolixibacter denitrificans]PSK83699.1 hypothetical protein CLV93_103114 [Prolixibacter denitrificans]GET23243.1 hypothetical protein JCM18694_34890 [Prolixibacter denitrificans]
MSQINHLLTSAIVAETADIANHVGIAIDNATLTDEYLNGENVKLKANSVLMVQGIGAERGKELKEELDAADARRDALFSALMHFLRGYQRWNKNSTGEAADVLYSIVKSHGSNIPRLSIEKESAMLDSILNAFQKEEAAQAITTLNLTELVTDLQSEQAHLQEVYQQSAELESEKPEVVAPSSIKRETQVILNGIIDYLNVMSKANAAVYGTLAATVAELVNTLNEKIKARYNSNNTSTENS